MIIQRGGVCVCVFGDGGMGEGVGGWGVDEIEWRTRAGTRIRERNSAHFIFIFSSSRSEPSRVSRHSTRTGCQILDPEPDGVDQSGYGNSV